MINIAKESIFTIKKCKKNIMFTKFQTINDKNNKI